MFDAPIKNVKQAKEYFRSMGCSHFHMGREYPQRYEEYKQLKISKQTEEEWIKEQFEEYYADIMEDKDGIPYWSIHARMYDLVEILKTHSALKKILEVTQHIRNHVSLHDRIVISETINGRRYQQFRSGLIYLAYDLNDIPLAKAFAQLSLCFATSAKQETSEFERSQRAAKLCNDIMVELGL